MLDQPGATYVLTQDVSAPGTAFVIGANGITLDLGGHSVEYNAAPSGTPVYGVVLGSATSWVNITSLRVTNGGIVQGAGQSAQSHAVYLRYGNVAGVALDNLGITIAGPDCRAIKVPWVDGLDIHHNMITSSVMAITSRANFDGYAIAVGTDGPADGAAIHDNTITGGHGGVVLNQGSGARIYGNVIAHRALETNGYGIALSCYSAPPGISDAQVYANNIHTDDGCGILVDCQYQNVEVYDNTISVKMGPKPEYGYSYVAWGIKCRTGPDVAARFGLKVHHNVITATTGDALVSEAAGIGIYDAHSNLGNEYYGNTITATTTSAARKAAGIIIAGDPGPDGQPIGDSGTKVYGNTITSNCYNIWIGFRDGVGQSGIRFTSNTLVKGANPLGYHTVCLGYWTYATQNHVFLDTRVSGGADVHDVLLGSASGGAPYSFYVKWYLDVAVREAAGNPVAGAAVTAAGRAGTETVTATTDAAGNARLALTEYYRYGMTYPPTSNQTAYTPHTITVTKQGYPDYSTQVTVDASKALAVNLAQGTAVTVTKTSDKTQAPPGGVITYTVVCTNVAAGALNSIVMTDAIPAACTYVPGSTRVNGTPVSPDPYAAGQLTVPVGTLNPGATVAITFQATIK